MFLDTPTLVKIAIVIGAIALFIGSFLLNKRTKAPKGVELPEKCISCPSDTCIIKLVDIETIKESIKQETTECEDKLK